MKPSKVEVFLDSVSGLSDHPRTGINSSRPGVQIPPTSPIEANKARQVRALLHLDLGMLPRVVVDSCRFTHGSAAFQLHPLRCPADEHKTTRRISTTDFESVFTPNDHWRCFLRTPSGPHFRRIPPQHHSTRFGGIIAPGFPHGSSMGSGINQRGIMGGMSRKFQQTK
jgi:hypothetical protein